MTEKTDLSARVYSGRVPASTLLAQRGRNWGWLLYAEGRLLGMRSYLQTILIASVGTPLLYVLAMGIGLGSLVDRGAGGVDGVPYLVFVGPGLLVSAIVMEAAGEFTYPIMTGFKWWRLYEGVQASPIRPFQIAAGELVAVGLRFVFQATCFWAILTAFGTDLVARAVLAGA